MFLFFKGETLHLLTSFGRLTPGGLSNPTLNQHSPSLLKGKWVSPQLLTHILYLPVVRLILLFSMCVKHIRVPRRFLFFTYGGLGHPRSSNICPLLPASLVSSLIYYVPWRFLIHCLSGTVRQSHTAIGGQRGGLYPQLEGTITLRPLP